MGGEMAWTVLEILSFIAVVIGVAMWSVPAGLIVFGALGLTASWAVNHK